MNFVLAMLIRDFGADTRALRFAMIRLVMMFSLTRFTKISLFTAILYLPSVTFATNSSLLYEQAINAYAAKDYARSGQLFIAAAEQDEGMADDCYSSAARSFALAGERDEAFLALEKATKAGFQDRWGVFRLDEDFVSLHGDKRWQAFLERAKENAKAADDFWNNESMQTGFRENLTEDEKVAGLSKLWAEAKYNFVFFNRRSSLNWDGVYMDYLPKVRATKSTFEYYRVLSSMYALLGDGHTVVEMPRELGDTAYARPLLRTRLIDGKVIVIAVDESLSATGIVPGVEITKVDGLAVKEYAQRHVAPYQSTSTPQDRDMQVYGRALLNGKKGVPVELVLRDAAGEISKRHVSRVSADEWSKKFSSDPVVFKMLPHNVAYVALNSFFQDKVVDLFEARFPEIAKADALVIDLRENGGGNSQIGDRVLACLTGTVFSGLRWETRDYKPVFRAWGKGETRFKGPLEKIAPNGKLHFTKPVVLLTSPRTYSAAEDFVATFRNMGRGKVIGEATGGSTGQPLVFPLPGGGYGLVCTKHNTFEDGSEFVGTGIKPDVVVSPTVADFRAGRDTVLETALATLALDMERSHVSHR